MFHHNNSSRNKIFKVIGPISKVVVLWTPFPLPQQGTSKIQKLQKVGFLPTENGDFKNYKVLLCRVYTASRCVCDRKYKQSIKHANNLVNETRHDREKKTHHKKTKRLSTTLRDMMRGHHIHNIHSMVPHHAVPFQCIYMKVHWLVAYFRC